MLWDHFLGHICTQLPLVQLEYMAGVISPFGDLCDCFCSERLLNQFRSEVQSRNYCCPGRQFVYKIPTSSGPTYTRSTTVTEMPHDDWRVLWHTSQLEGGEDIKICLGERGGAHAPGVPWFCCLCHGISNYPLKLDVQCFFWPDIHTYTHALATVA